MKTFISFLFVIAFAALQSVFAQSPQKLNYQAVVRDASGNPLVSTNIGIRLSILQGSAAGTEVCVEEFNPVTNDYGLVTLEIGSVNAVDFEAIDWSAGPYYLKIELDEAGGTSYTEIGTSQLLSVPYALHAATANRTIGDSLWKQSGTDIYFEGGNVGIGESSPATKLYVGGAAAIHTNAFYGFNATYISGTGFRSIDGTNYGAVLKYETDGDFNLFSGITESDGGSSKVTIDHNGNFGIGTSSPAYKLEIHSPELETTVDSKSNWLRLTGNSGNTENLFIYNKRYTAGTNWNSSEIRIQKQVDATPMHYISFKGLADNDSRLEIGYNNTSSFFINKFGNVGLKVANPEATLDVNGSIKTRSGSGTVLFGATNPTGIPDGDGFRIRWEQDFMGTQYLDALVFEKTDFNSNAPDGLMAFVNTGVDGVVDPAMVVRGDGRVGVGTINPSGKLAVETESGWSDEAPLFEVKNSDGTPVFAVYNNGVRILVEDDPAKKGPKGGFAIGGFDPTKAGSTVEFMRITPDSIRFNINNSATKGPKGGFAIGGFDRTKGVINEDFMNITPQATDQGLYNTFLGYKSGEMISSTGSYNCYFGYESGRNNSGGDYNTFMGYQAGKNSTNSWNTFIGYRAGLITTGASNVFIGDGAGENSTSADINVFIGKNAGNDNTSGDENTYVGMGAGASNQLGSYNTFIGGKSGLNNKGTENTLIGSQAMPLNTSGNQNVALGYQAGYQNTSGSGNVYLGYMAGRNDTGSGRLYIDNSSTSSPLIYGNFATDRININGEMWVYGDGVENYALVTNGGTHSTRSLFVYKGAYTTGSWQTSSDIRYKDNIMPIEDAIEIIESISGVRFDFKTDDFSEMGFSDERQIGVVAQDVEKVLPELVTEDEEGYKAVAYDKLTSVLIQAVKEQQTEIEDLKMEIDQLRQMMMEISEGE